jgi:serine protease Do
MKPSTGLGLFFSLALALTGAAEAAAPPQAKAAPVPAAAVQVSTSGFARVVALAAPSIVSITANRRGWTAAPGPALSPLPGLPDDGSKKPGEGDALLVPPGPSLGSGVIVSSDGFIVTNSHVIDGSDEIRVALSSGTELPAKIVGKDTKTDIAVIRVDARNLPPATFGDSSKNSIGDVVLALGNPFGLGQTVTMGIISATGRGNIGLEDFEDFIQTDAAINPGNSGGALVNAEGAVIGINTAILSRNGGNQGIGFAVPSNLVRQVMTDLIKNGRVPRGYLGVTVQDLTPALAKQFGVEPPGALVSDVVKDGPGAAAGLKSGDVISTFDGKPVRDSRTLRLQAGQTPPERQVELTVRRGAKTVKAQVTLREIKETPAQSSLTAAAKAPPPRAMAGAILEDMTAEDKTKLEIPGEVRGALVTAIERGSPAYESGLRPGDVVQEVDRRPIASAHEAWEAVRGARDSDLLLRVWESGTSHYLVVKLRDG